MKKKIAIVILSLVLVCGCGKQNEKNTDDSINILHEIKLKDSGNTLTTAEIKEGGLLEQPDDPTKEGFMFVRWSSDGETFDFSQPITDDFELVAEWKAVDDDTVEYIVKFDSVGGTTIENQIVDEGDVVTKPSDPVKNGYTFLGWGINGVSYDFKTTVTKNITLSAIWKNNDLSLKNSESDNTDIIQLETPSLSYEFDDNYNAELSIIETGEYECDGKNTSISKLGIDGWELYEKIGSSYVKISESTSLENIKANIDLNATRTFAARVFKKETAKKVYSDYSNELVLTNKLFTPKLSYSEVETLKYNFDISYNGGFENIGNNFTGIEIYEKVNSSFQLYKSISDFKEKISVTLSQGTTRTFKCRIVAKNNNGKVVYSSYSNEIVLDGKIKKPTIDNGNNVGYKGVIHNGIYGEDIYLTNWEDYDEKSTGHVTIGGWEVYEKTSNGYKKINELTTAVSTAIEIPVGQKKTVAVRMYTLDSKKNRVYSDYSNEVVIDGTIKTPEIVNGDSVGYDGVIHDGVYGVDVYISNIEDYYYDNEGSLTFNGFEVYEKTKKGYNKLSEELQSPSAVVEIPINDKKTIAIRMYALNTNNQRVYSEYSNEVVIDGTIKTPEIIDGDSAGYEGVFHDGVYGVDIYITNWADYAEYVGAGTIAIGGWEIYEKTKNGYNKIGEQTTAISGAVEIPINDKKTIVVRMYALNTNNQRVYSDYSNEVVVNGKIKTPVLTLSGYGGYFEDGKYGEDICIPNWYDFDDQDYGSITIGGWEIYEKTKTGYNKLDEVTTGVCYALEIPEGQKKTIVIRMYALNTNNQRVYSDYSNEVILDGTNNN